MSCILLLVIAFLSFLMLFASAQQSKSSFHGQSWAAKSSHSPNKCCNLINKKKYGEHLTPQEFLCKACCRNLALSNCLVVIGHFDGKGNYYCGSMQQYLLSSMVDCIPNGTKMLKC